MVIVFCKTCGLRIPPADIEAGLTVGSDDEVLCAKCTPAFKKASTEAKKATTEIRVPLAEAARSTVLLSAARATPAHGNRVSASGITGRARARARSSTQVIDKNRVTEPQPSPPASRKNLVIAAGGGLCLLALIVFAFIGPAKKTNVSSAETKSESKPQVTIPEKKPSDVASAAPSKASEEPAEKPRGLLDSLVEERRQRRDATGPALPSSRAETNAKSAPFSEPADNAVAVASLEKSGAGAVAPPPTRAAFVKGSLSDLFADRVSYVENNVSKLDGWIWSSRETDGFAVKDGVCSFSKPGNLILGNFTSKEFEVSLEVELSKDSALGIITGSANELSNMLLVTPAGAIPATLEAGKAANDVQPVQNDGRLHGITTPWVPLRIVIRNDGWEVFNATTNKSIMKAMPPKTVIMPSFGFLLLGQNNNHKPTAKIRNVKLLAQ
jgi:hypothetical protein